MKIEYTKDLSQFSDIPGNRALSRQHLDELKRSIQVKNLLEFHPIVVNEYKEVIDGQHRLVAAEELGCGIYYVEGKGLGFDDIKLLNINTKNWTLNDYLDSYVRKGNSYYKKFKEFYETYRFGISECIGMLLNDSHRNWSDLTRFKNGKLEFDETKYNEAARRATMISDFKPYFDHYRDRGFVTACLNIFENPKYDHKRMMERLEKVGTLFIQRQVTSVEYLRTLETVYNYKMKQEVRLF